MAVPVVPCTCEQVRHPDGRVSVVVKPDILALKNAVGEEKAEEIMRATQGRTISPA